eukprot:765966-Hanusia_phi.AAC.11
MEGTESKFCELCPPSTPPSLLVGVNQGRVVIWRVGVLKERGGQGPKHMWERRRRRVQEIPDGVGVEGGGVGVEGEERSSRRKGNIRRNGEQQQQPVTGPTPPPLLLLCYRLLRSRSLESSLLLCCLHFSLDTNCLKPNLSRRCFGNFLDQFYC